MQLEVKQLSNPDIYIQNLCFAAAQQGNYSTVTPTDRFGDIISPEH